MTGVWERFHVLEGLDGAGTTTQLRMLGQKLQASGIDVHTTFEPTSNEIGLLIKRVLKGEVRTTPLSLAYLYAGDRQDHLFNPEYGIREQLDRGKTVISDRYFYSSLAYQTIDSPFDTVRNLNDFPFPQTVIYLDTPVEECLKRIDHRGDKKEIFEKQAILEKVRANYELSFLQNPGEVKLFRFDGTLDKDTLNRQILREVFGL